MSDDLDPNELRRRLMDYRGMYDREFIGSWDLPPGKDAVVVISKVECKVLSNGKTKNKKPCIWFEGKELAFPLNKTNGKTIAALYGNETKHWVGKPIAIYATTTDVGGQTVDCIRVKARAPVGNAATSAGPAKPREPGDE